MLHLIGFHYRFRRAVPVAFRTEKRALQADHTMTQMDRAQKEGAFISFAADSLKAPKTHLHARQTDHRYGSR